jgi:TPR repeat protein
MGLVLALLAWPASAQDFRKGLAANRSGNYEAAYQELRPLATRGNARAQYILGHGYFEGKGVPKDYVRAYMWFRFAEIRGYRPGARGRKMVAQRMTAEQIAAAQRQAREWLEAQ